MSPTEFAKTLQVLGVPIRCEGCGWIIDPTTCWCGESIPGGHCDNHSPVPAGCTCSYTDAEGRRNPEFFPPPGGVLDGQSEAYIQDPEHYRKIMEKP